MTPPADVPVQPAPILRSYHPPRKHIVKSVTYELREPSRQALWHARLIKKSSLYANTGNAGRYSSVVRTTNRRGDIHVDATKKQARLAGLLYVLVAITAPIG